MGLKDYYDGPFTVGLADRIGRFYPQLDQEGFLSYVVPQLDGKEYTQRMGVFVRAFDRYLPPYPDTLGIFSAMLAGEPELKSFAVMYSDGTWLAPVGKYVEAHCGADETYFQKSVDLIRELTTRYTGEFAMRALVQAFPDRGMVVLLAWSRSKNPYVRRCASECMRVRLPWARKMTAAVERFDSYCRVLDNLKNDPNPYVQRSVGNNLNDLYKHDEQKARAIMERWQSESPPETTLRIVRHGMRTARKVQRRARGRDA